MDEQIATFEQFWPHYVRAHSKRATRLLHFAGTATAVVTAAIGLLTRRPWLVALSPALGYAPGWLGHTFVDEKRPAPPAHPLWSMRADLTMVAKMLDGSMEDEVERVMKADRAKAGSNGESKNVHVNVPAPARPDPSTLN